MEIGSWTAAESNTDVGETSRRPRVTKGARNVNDGENGVFPIQVSRSELLLFLGAVIVIGTYENIFYMRA